MLHADVAVRLGSFELDVELEVARGETVAVMGPNGSGKSTLLAALAGLLAVERGTVRVGERMLTGPGVTVPPQHRAVGLLGQEPLLFPHLSVLKNVEFGMPRGAGASTRLATGGASLTEPVEVSTRSTRARDWLAAVGLSGFEHRRPHQLSGGQQQRVAIARALAAEPDVLLLDEPMASLDTENAQLVRDLLAARLGFTATVLVTHDVADALALAQRTVLLDAGRVTRCGPTVEVLATLGVGLRVDGLVGEDGRVRLPDGVELAPGQRVTVMVRDA